MRRVVYENILVCLRRLGSFKCDGIDAGSCLSIPPDDVEAVATAVVIPSEVVIAILLPEE